VQHTTARLHAKGIRPMSLSELFIKRPITTTLIMLGIGVFGIMAYRLLPVSDLPVVDFPTIQVQASLPGASPATVASSVALPLEKQFSTIAGLDALNSASSLGSTTITLQFDLDRNIDAAAQDVNSMIAKAARLLPPTLPTPPSYQKVNPADQPVILLALYSKTQPVWVVDDYAENMMAQRISTVNGVAQVQVFGGAKYAVRIDVDPRPLSAHSIGLDQVATAITNANVNLPTGTMFGRDKTITLLSNGQLMKAAEYGPMVIGFHNGSPTRLDEVAKVYDGVETAQNANYFVDADGTHRAVTLAVYKQPGVNVVQIVDDIKALMPTFRQQLPPSIALEQRSDRSLSIRDSVADVKVTLLLTIGLVVAVIFLFLRNLSATIIPSLALPASIVATFAVMYLLHYSLDNLSLMALTLSVGFVVDDAIVMLENIVRHMEMGKSPMRAAVDGSREISFTILSMTISLAAVFIPILFMGGIVGRLLHEFSVTIGVAILVSGAVSISLTPMLCSRFLKPPHAQKHGAFYLATERMFDSWLRAYDWSLRLSLKYRAITMAASIGLLAGTWYLFSIIPAGFLPVEDQGRFNVNVEAAEGIGYDEMTAKMLAVGDIIRTDPDVQAFTINVGSPTGALIQNGRLNVDLKPLSERKRTIQEIVAALRPKLTGVTGVRAYPLIQPPITIGGQQNARALYQFTLQDTDLGELYQSAQALQDKMQRMVGLVDVSSDMQIKNPQVTIQMNRDKIAALGLSANQVETALYNAYGTRSVSQIYADNNQYNVILQVDPQFQQDPAALAQIYVTANSGQLVPLSTVATLNTSRGASNVSHTGQLPSVTLSFNLKDGYALGDAVDQIQAAAATLPSTVSTMFQGSAQAFQNSVKGLGLILVMSIVIIYIVLGILYESFTHPLTILSGLPSAGFGALLTLVIFRTELSLYAFVGVIMLVGLVKKNGIMMVDFAVQAQREHGKGPLEAIHEACLVRFRPITMTTFAALVGTLPIALGWGAGAESRRPLGLAVVGGLVVSQLLTLYITPVYYVYIEGARLWLMRRRAAGSDQPDALDVEASVAEKHAVQGGARA
jgi:HAE1 family hydrophobic/amphiphilic exporter-1